MKTLTRILFAIVMIALTASCSKSDERALPAESNHSLKKLNAQGNGSEVLYSDWAWGTAVYCDGEVVDNVDCWGKAHVMAHFQDGEPVYVIIVLNGSGKGIYSGESFSISSQAKYFTTKPDKFLTLHANIKGDKGSLYHVSIFMNTTDYSFTVKNANCTGNVD